RVIARWLPSLGRKYEVTIDELLALLHLALKNATQVILLPDHVRRENEQKVSLTRRCLCLAKEKAQDGNITQDWHLVLRGNKLILHQTTDHYGLLIFNNDGGRCCAFGDGNYTERTGRCLSSAAF